MKQIAYYLPLINEIVVVAFVNDQAYFLAGETAVFHKQRFSIWIELGEV